MNFPKLSPSQLLSISEQNPWNIKAFNVCSILLMEFIFLTRKTSHKLYFWYFLCFCFPHIFASKYTWKWFRLLLRRIEIISLEKICRNTCQWSWKYITKRLIEGQDLCVMGNTICRTLMQINFTPQHSDKN
jgi:hypothetical protein